MANTEGAERTVRIDDLRRCLEACLLGLGCPEPDARRIAEVLLDGELRGYDDHGAFFIGELAGWMRSGAVNPTPRITALRQTPASVLLDGDRGCGAVGATEAMRRAIDLARQSGLACAEFWPMESEPSSSGFPYGCIRQELRPGFSRNPNRYAASLVRPLSTDACTDRRCSWAR